MTSPETDSSNIEELAAKYLSFQTPEYKSQAEAIKEEIISKYSKQLEPLELRVTELKEQKQRELEKIKSDEENIVYALLSAAHNYCSFNLIGGEWFARDFHTWNVLFLIKFAVLEEADISIFLTLVERTKNNFHAGRNRIPILNDYQLVGTTPNEQKVFVEDKAETISDIHQQVLDSYNYPVCRGPQFYIPTEVPSMIEDLKSNLSEIKLYLDPKYYSGALASIKLLGSEDAEVFRSALYIDGSWSALK